MRDTWLFYKPTDSHRLWWNTVYISYARNDLQRTYRFASNCRCHGRAWTSRPPDPGKSPWPTILKGVVVLASLDATTCHVLRDIISEELTIGAHDAPSPPCLRRDPLLWSEILAKIRAHRIYRVGESPAILYAIACGFDRKSRGRLVSTRIYRCNRAENYFCTRNARDKTFDPLSVYNRDARHKDTSLKSWSTHGRQSNRRDKPGPRAFRTHTHADSFHLYSSMLLVAVTATESRAIFTLFIFKRAVTEPVCVCVRVRILWETLTDVTC